MTEFRNLRSVAERLRQSASRASAGGEWSMQLPAPVQRNLRWFFFDGLSASGSDAIAATYLTLFLLAMGATRAQIGLLASLASLLAVLLLIPGAMLADRSRSRKAVVLLSGGGISRLTLLLFALTPFILPGSTAVYPIIALKVLSDGMGNLSLPAWTSLTADVVPMRWRGRYFGARNLVMGTSNMIFTLIAGQIITWAGSPHGYQIAFGMSFALGLASFFSFSRIQEPPPLRAAAAAPDPTAPGAASPAAASYTLRALLATLQSDRNFLSYFIFTLMWNLALTIAGPFFNLYLVEGLHATAAAVGVLAIISSLSGLPAQRFFGGLIDRLGAHRLMLMTGWLIPALPLAWSLVTAAWQVAVINVVSGVLWAGFGLASFNLLLNIAPPEQRARYTALFQISVAVAGTLGAALGGIIATRWGYQVLFALSGIGRIVAMLVYTRFVSQPPAEPEVDVALYSPEPEAPTPPEESALSGEADTAEPTETPPAGEPEGEQPPAPPDTTPPPEVPGLPAEPPAEEDDLSS